jgi:hypothetical protein
MANRRSPDTPNPANPAEPVPAQAAAGARRPRKPAAAAPAPTRVKVTPEARRALIAENAYLRAERRGFEPGHETEDWLAAEAEVEALLSAEHGGSPQ